MSDRGKRFDGKSLTKQSYKKGCDINNIIAGAARTGTISHLNRNQARYGDISGFDYNEAMNRVAEARSLFEDLPAEVRREFNGDIQSFISFVDACAAEGKSLAEELPALAAPGRQLPISGASAPPAHVDPPAKAVVEEAPKEPPKAAEGG